MELESLVKPLESGVDVKEEEDFTVWGKWELYSTDIETRSWTRSYLIIAHELAISINRAIIQ